jgi:hypothetical protein
MFSSPSIVIGRGHPTAKADVVAPRNAAVPRKLKYLIALCSLGWSGASAHVPLPYRDGFVARRAASRPGSNSPTWASIKRLPSGRALR